MYLPIIDLLRNSLTSLPITVLSPRNFPNIGTASPILSVANSAHVTPKPLRKAIAKSSPSSVTLVVNSYFPDSVELSGLSPSRRSKISSPAGPNAVSISGVIFLNVSAKYLCGLAAVWPNVPANQLNPFTANLCFKLFSKDSSVTFLSFLIISFLVPVLAAVKAPPVAINSIT